MKLTELNKLTSDLEQLWHEKKCLILDRDNCFYEHDIEREFYESNCVELGYYDNQIEVILKHMGY